MEEYDHKKIEKKWQKYWEKNKTFKAEEGKSKKKFYVLDMFPYPSGLGLHVGHPKGYVATDIYARYMMLKGYNVLHPMGFDSFGLPAENYAIKHKIHPQKAVDKNIEHFKKQLKQFGFTYDWNQQVVTSDPNYYKWTQWIFLQMFKKGLVYESYEPINWCPSCKTGLANEDLENGKCERCGSQVVKKPIRQWVLKMTDYAERLLDDLKLVDWEKSIVDQQINWIGKSQGSIIKFKLKTENCNLKTNIEVFTTRADTLCGATYLVVAPEHKIIQNSEFRIQNSDEVKKYINNVREKSDLQRTGLSKEKTGIEIKGIKAINPANGDLIPIFVADYVLSSYGTGAIMAVPAHDERDFEFASRFHLPVRQVIAQTQKDTNKNTKLHKLKLPYEGEGKLINSGKFNGMNSQKARNEITKFIKGKKTVKYKMRDWVFSRQRYWGEPIPLVFCKNCAENSKFKSQNSKLNKGEILNPGWIAIDNLPIRLPEVKNYKPTNTGESPLANIDNWVNVKCPKCGGSAKRETNTMPQWAGSCWYYLAYIMQGISPPSPPIGLRRVGNFPPLGPISKYKKGFNKWLPVDLYVGGAEHATRHLLYTRFWHKFLYDIDVVGTKEPFYKFKHVGLIRGKDGRKMSKRWENIVNPDDVINRFGADAFRMYEMFMGPFSDSISWDTSGVKGTKRFLDRLFELLSLVIKNKNKLRNKKSNNINTAIKKIGDDIEKFKFNTAISSLMIYFNERDFAPKINNSGKLEGNNVDISAIEKFLQILSPFAPHISDELWSQLGHRESIFKSKWPEITKKNVKLMMDIPVMVNGKKRALLEIESTKKISDREIIKLAFNEKNVIRHTEGKKIKKKMCINTKTGKIISIVV